jgi:hypothetical protein
MNSFFDCTLASCRSFALFKPPPGMMRQIVTRTEEDVIDFKL